MQPSPIQHGSLDSLFCSVCMAELPVTLILKQWIMYQLNWYFRDWDHPYHHASIMHGIHISSWVVCEPTKDSYSVWHECTACLQLQPASESIKWTLQRINVAVNLRFPSLIRVHIYKDIRVRLLSPTSEKGLPFRISGCQKIASFQAPFTLAMYVTLIRDSAL